MNEIPNRCEPKNRGVEQRRRSQLLGLVVLAILVLIVTCVRYYFRLG